MDVILMERITNLGDLGEQVTVKNGFARNFLIPKGKAVRASADNRKVFEDRRSELEAAANAKLSDAERRALALEGQTVTIVARVGTEGKLYGSVGPVEIAQALTDAGIEVHRSEVRMPEGAIRVAGEYEVDVQIHADVTRIVQVIVAAE